MPSPVGSLSGIRLPELIQPAPAGNGPGNFKAALEGAIHRVEQSRGQAAEAVDRFLYGESEELHTAVLAAQRAELTLELFLQVRNKVVQAYQEIMRMPV